MKKILIADHIEKHRDILKRALATHGLPTCEVASPEEALNISENEIMLVLLASHFRDLNAFDILAKTREKNIFSGIPFVICTSKDDPDHVAKCVKAGFKGVILRPYNRKQVFQQVKNILIEEGMLDRDMFLGDDQSEKIKEGEKIEFLRHVLEIAPASIAPVYNPEVNNAYSYPVLNEFFGISPGEGFSILRELHSENVLSRTLFDKVGLCPTCNFHTLNFREVCPKCRSLEIEIESIYHHFSCGYVGPADDFRDPVKDEMHCPKCDKVLRHIGLDYEKPSDTFICRECQFIFTEPEVEFKCFYCDIVAPADEVVISNVYSYYPNKKTKKVVEYGSFTAFDIKEVIMDEREGQYNRDFIDFMLKIKYREHCEYGDPLIIAVYNIAGAGKSVFEDLATYIAANAGSTDLMHRNEEGVIVQIISRRVMDFAVGAAERVLTFGADLRKKNPSAAGMKCAVFLREFRDKIHEIDSFVDSSVDIFNANKDKIQEEVWVYEE